MVSLEEIFAEVETIFKSYAESGDIDRVSIKGWVINCLNELGKNICEQNEVILEVKNSQAKLPDTFKSLILAYHLDPKGYTIYGDREKAQDSFIYKQRIEQPAYFDWVTNEYVSGCDSKIVTEKIVMNGQPTELYYYPQYLSVVKGFNKESFDVDCINLHPSIRNSFPHQISINKRTLQANFKSGHIYLQYNSLPQIDGEVAVPEISTGDIKKHVLNVIKLGIAEELILNNKNPNPGLQSLMGVWAQQSITLRNGAKSEANWSGLSKNWSKGYKKRLETERDFYNLPKR